MGDQSAEKQGHRSRATKLSKTENTTEDTNIKKQRQQANFSH